MGEYNEQSSHPNFYEQLAPEYRFVRISNAILDQIGELTPDGGKTKFASWQGKQKGNHFKLRATKERNIWGHKSVTFYLEHFIDELPGGRPLEFYSASTSGSGISTIGVYDGSGKPKQTEPEDRRNAIQQLLSVLRDIAPEVSDELLNEIFSSRYESLIGAYVLSDMARKGQEETITYFTTWQAIENHLERVDAIKETVLERSKLHDSPAKQEAIEEAITSSRTRTNKNTYEPVNIQTAAERVAKEIVDKETSKKWKYTVSPEQ